MSIKFNCVRFDIIGNSSPEISLICTITWILNCIDVNIYFLLNWEKYLSRIADIFGVSMKVNHVELWVVRSYFQIGHSLIFLDKDIVYAVFEKSIGTFLH
jgi:hypothetical protein